MYETLAKAMSVGAKLKLRCEACGHTAEWDRRSAFRLFGHDATPYTIARRARCVVCREPRRVAVSVG